MMQRLLLFHLQQVSDFRGVPVAERIIDYRVFNGLAVCTLMDVYLYVVLFLVPFKKKKDLF